MTVDDPAFKAYVTGLAAAIDALGPKVVDGAATYYQTKDPTLVSKDKHATLIPVVMAGKQDTAMKNVAPAARARADSGQSRLHARPDRRRQPQPDGHRAGRSPTSSAARSSACPSR